MQYWDEEFTEVKPLVFVGRITTSPTVVKSVSLGLFNCLWKKPRLETEHYVFMFCDNGCKSWWMPTGQQMAINHDYASLDDRWSDCVTDWKNHYKCISPKENESHENFISPIDQTIYSF